MRLHMEVKVEEEVVLEAIFSLEHFVCVGGVMVGDDPVDALEMADKGSGV